LFGALAWYASQLVAEFMEPGTQPPFYAEFNAVIGAVMGWLIARSRARGPWMAAISYGLTATLALIFWWLFLHSFYDMIIAAMRGHYGADPTMAVVDVFRLMLDHSLLMAHSTVVTTFIAGAVLCGLGTEWIGRRFN
jgi:hypothetical protein